MNLQDAEATLAKIATFEGADAVDKMQTNSIPTRDGHMSMFEHVCRINHSCESNVRVTLGADGALSFVALRDLQVGEEVLDNYLAEVHGKDADAAVRLEMRRHLAERF